MSNIVVVFFLEEEKRKDTIEIDKDMLGFIKIFLQGILYVVLLPFILLLLALYCVYCIIVFIYMAIRSIIVFFSGGTPLGDLPEDVEAKRILMEREQAKSENTTQSLADALVQSQLQITQALLNQQNQTSETAEQTELDKPVFETSNEEENKIEEYSDDQSN